MSPGAPRVWLLLSLAAASLQACRLGRRAGTAAAPALAQQQPPPGEEADISRLTDVLLRLQQERLLEKGRPARRGQHAKHQGCVRADFEALPDAPPEARHGVFREPGRRYPAWIRFSNGSEEPRPDTRPDAHGMAVKLMGAEQDFILIDHPVFFLRSVRDAAELFEAVAAGRGRSFFFNGLNPLRWRLRELRLLRASTSKEVSNPLAERYFSALPSRLGPGAVKYSARPCAPVPALRPRRPGPDFLREAMAASLREGPACFLFMVQRQTDPVRMPIEDSTVPWDERDSPFIPVARITIPPQDFDTPARQELCESLRFNPWRSLPEHEPLGGIQRARRKAYAVLSGFRSMKNGAPRGEPRPDDPVS